MSKEIERLQAIIAARTNPDGTHRKGWRRSVVMAKAQLAKLQALSIPRTA